MKKLLTLFAILLSLTSFGQVVTGGTASYFFFQPYNFSRVHVSDSVQISATALTNQQVTGILWTQTAGSAVKMAPTFNWQTGIAGNSYFWLQGLPAGGYGFNATVTLANGQTYATHDSLTVVADAACPVCPAPRTVTSFTINIGGVSVTVPASGAKFNYSDGSSQ